MEITVLSFYHVGLKNKAQVLKFGSRHLLSHLTDLLVLLAFILLKFQCVFACMCGYACAHAPACACVETFAFPSVVLRTGFHVAHGDL